ncbi:hypothetical protein GYMLUDRAFT_161421, partial [Collybiopsis luxurians FD-317 M1]
SNVVAFENPTPKIYDILLPPQRNIEEVLAIMFSGSCERTNDDYKHALLFVRCDVVADALKFLILNSAAYDDVIFSQENLEGYGNQVPIVSVEFFQKNSTCTAEGVSVFLQSTGLLEKTWNR